MPNIDGKKFPYTEKGKKQAEEYKKSKSGGGPFSMKTYGKGKNPIEMLGDLDKDNKLSGYEKNRQDAIEKNMEKDAAPKMNYGSPVEKYGSPVEKYKDTKSSMATKKKKLKEMDRQQQKAVFASGYKG